MTLADYLIEHIDLVADGLDPKLMQIEQILILRYQTLIGYSEPLRYEDAPINMPYLSILAQQAPSYQDGLDTFFLLRQDDLDAFDEEKQRALLSLADNLLALFKPPQPLNL